MLSVFWKLKVELQVDDTSNIIGTSHSNKLCQDSKESVNILIGMSH